MFTAAGTPSNVLRGTTTASISSLPTTAFSDLYLESPSIGNYYLMFDAGALTTLQKRFVQVNLTVTAGSISKLEVFLNLQDLLEFSLQPILLFQWNQTLQLQFLQL